MLKVAVKCMEEVIIFIRSCNSFASKLTKNDWNHIKVIVKFLKPFYSISVFCEGSTYQTIYFSISAFNIMYDAVHNLDDLNLGLKNAIERASSKIKKYYTATDYSPIHHISTVLSPSYKLDYFIQNNRSNTAEIKELYVSFYIDFLFTKALEDSKPNT